jgi:Leucine rich repeat
MERQQVAREKRLQEKDRGLKCSRCNLLQSNGSPMKDRNRNSKSNGSFNWKTGFARVSHLPTVILTVGLLVCLFIFDLGPTARAQGMASLIPASEYNALTNLFASTGGASWLDNTGWNDPTAATWTGVTVLDGHVAYIDLNENQLTGTIPTTLNELPYLQGLDLSQNQLSGSIPTNWDSLTNLQSLYLYESNLTGRIPVGLLQLPLVYIDVSFNHLTGPILHDIGKWAQVLTINFGYNQLRLQSTLRMHSMRRDPMHKFKLSFPGRQST